jgi:hypothetical protein
MWGRQKQGDLERELHRRRAVAPDALVDELSHKVSAASVRGRRPGLARVAFASAVSVFVLGTFASFGGISYAASGASGTYGAVKQIVVEHKLTVKKSSAADQYPSPPKNEAGGVAGVHKTTPAPANAAPVASGTLPFTGVSLLGTLTLSLVLIGVGFALRRRESRS